jgi:hypothetical protein
LKLATFEVRLGSVGERRNPVTVDHEIEDSRRQIQDGVAFAAENRRFGAMPFRSVL